ncbi:MAG: hypothetical protein LBH76_02400 [Propionibacteriaceae bacterium]|jgi:hypothetical protein|nr:hypothetical protein [Propionibacteriaceae bacterium]
MAMQSAPDDGTASPAPARVTVPYPVIFSMVPMVMLFFNGYISHIEACVAERRAARLGTASNPAAEPRLAAEPESAAEPSPAAEPGPTTG